MQVKDLMHAHPVSVDNRQTIEHAATLLERLNVRHLPVLQGTRLVGMLSDRDFREVLGDGFDEERRAEIAARAVDSIVPAEVVSVAPEASVTEAVDLMLDRKVGALPVVDDGHVLVGILSYTDLLQAIKDRLDN